MRHELSFQKRDLRTVIGMAFAFFCLLMMLSLVGCAPDVKQREFGRVKTDFGPLQRDVDLGLDGIQQKGVNHSLLEWYGEIDSARLFRASEHLMTLGEMRGSQKLTDVGRKLGQSFYQADGAATKTSFGNSLYISAIIGETKQDSLQKVYENDAMLAKQVLILTQVAADIGRTFPWPQKGASAREIFDSVEGFIEQFVATTKAIVDPKIHDAMVKSLNKKFFPIIRDMRLETESIFTEPRALDIIARFRDLAKRNDLELGPDSVKQLAEGEDLFRRIEAIRKPHDALTVLVIIFERMDKTSRDTKFKEISKDLYEYLDGKSERELRCVKNPDCKNPLIWLPKKIAILPAIEKQGVENIRQQMLTEARVSLIEELQAGVADVAPEIPIEVGRRIVQEITDIRAKLQILQSDYPAFVRRIADGYAAKYLTTEAGTPAPIIGFEASRIRVAVGPNRAEVAPLERGSSVMTGAETIGSAMALSAALWRYEAADSLFYKRSVLSQVNKLLAMGGFETEAGTPFPSLTVALDPTAKNRRFYVRDFSSATGGYVVPDALRVNENGTTAYDDRSVDASVRGQAEMLRGLSALIRAFRDWERSPFDEVLGKTQIGELITEVPAEGLTDKLFPKDVFFALTIGNAGGLLKNLTKTMSPVFLVGIDKKVVWSNELDESKEGDPTTIAGVVDIKEGKRAESVKTKNVARFLLAVSEFLEATEGIERTKSDVLLEKGEDGKTPVDMLVEAREDIKLLGLAMANFLSNQVQQKDGGFRTAFNHQKIDQPVREPRQLIDQALGVLALARVADALDKDVYRWAAMDGLAFMNRVLWNPKVGFYRSVEGTDVAPSFDEVTAALLAGERLRLHLNEKRREQWDKVAGPWYTAFENL